MSTVCRSEGCDARVIWVETQRGKRMPLDANPDIEEALGNAPITYEELRDMLGKETVVSHFSTCKFANAWRQGRSPR